MTFKRFANEGRAGEDGTDGAPGAQGPPGPNEVSTDVGNRAIIGGDSKIWVPSMGLRQVPTFYTGDAEFVVPTNWRIIQWVMCGCGGGGGASHSSVNNRCGMGGWGAGTCFAWIDWATYIALRDELLVSFPTADNFKFQISVSSVGGAGGTAGNHGLVGPNTGLDLGAFQGDARLGSILLVRAYGGLGGVVGATTNVNSIYNSFFPSTGSTGFIHASLSGFVINGQPGCYGGQTAALTTNGGHSALGAGARCGSWATSSTDGSGIDAVNWGGGGSGGARQNAAEGGSFPGGRGGPGLAYMVIYD